MSNQLVVDAVNSKIFLPDSAPGIDTTNIIAANASTPYTATQDCWCTITGAKTNPSIGQKINDVTIANATCWTEIYYSSTVFLKKGQKASISSGTGTVNVYGLKY